MTFTTRRRFVSGAPALFSSPAFLSACSRGSDAEGYEAVALQTWRLGFIGFDKGGRTWVGHDNEVRAAIALLLLPSARP